MIKEIISKFYKKNVLSLKKNKKLVNRRFQNPFESQSDLICKAIRLIDEPSGVFFLRCHELSSLGRSQI